MNEFWQNCILMFLGTLLLLGGACFCVAITKMLQLMISANVGLNKELSLLRSQLMAVPGRQGGRPIAVDGPEIYPDTSRPHDKPQEGEVTDHSDAELALLEQIQNMRSSKDPNVSELNDDELQSFIMHGASIKENAE